MNISASQALRLGLLFILLFALALLLIRMATTGYDVFDHNLSELIRSWRNPQADFPMLSATLLGNWPIVTCTVIAMCSVLIYRRYWSLLVGVLSTMAASGAFVSGVKSVVQAARPESDLYTKGVSVFSFPSGHTTFSTLLGMLLIWFSWRGIQNTILRSLSIIVISVMMGLVAVSRIYLGAHWPTDIAAGFLFSASVALVFSLLLAHKPLEPAVATQVIAFSGLTYIVLGIIYLIAIWPSALIMYAH
ncbi:MAG: phosphatase PAP2 family protein [Thiothrix sp.]|nr:MAG: phosphatase PAP2 family protein [Thiothrix sp.]